MISIITPHYNNFSGLENLLVCLKNQESNAWEWIIVDDLSSVEELDKLKQFGKKNKDLNIRILFNTHKQNASVCRNQGAQLATYNKIVFLDSDDTILPQFVDNRKIQNDEFVVFLNILTTDGKNRKPFSSIKNDYLNNFLKAKFPWQTTSILFNKDYFFKIGGFDNNLQLLQDVEMSIRILLKGNNYQIITNNEVDFLYHISKIDINKRTLAKVSDSVIYLLNKLNNQYQLNKIQKRNLSSYYFLVVRYFVKSNQKDDLFRLKNTLKVFYKTKSINFFQYLVGRFFIQLLNLKIFGKNQFLKLNRYVFKK